MRVSKLGLRNFLSFGNDPQEITFDSLTTIVGPNDSGKTNIFRALSLLSELFANPSLDLSPYYHQGDRDRQLEIKVAVEFDRLEIEAFTDFLACSTLSSEPIAQNPTEVEVVSKLKAELLKGAPRTVYDDFFARTTLQVVGPWPQSQKAEIQIRIEIENHELFIDRPGVLHIRPSQVYVYSSTNFAQVLKERMRAAGATSISLEERDIYPFISQVLQQPGEWGISIPGFDPNYMEQRYGSRDELRRLMRYLRSKGMDAKYIDLFSLVGVIFRSSICRIADFRSPSEVDLETSSDPRGRLALGHLDGPGLTSFLFQLKNSNDSTDRKCLDSIASQFRDLSNGMGFDVVVQTERLGQATPEVVPSPQNPMVAQAVGDSQTRVLTLRDKETVVFRHTSSLLVTRKGLSVPISLAAAGIFEQLVLATILVASNDGVVLLDEPASNLHPMIQRRLIGLLKTSVTKGRNQVIMVTHSPYLTGISEMDHTWRVGREGDSSVAHSVGETLGKLSSEERVRVLLKLRQPELRALLFSRGVVFVEGPSDKIVIEEADRHLSEKGLGADLEGAEWTVVYLDGKDSLGTFLDLVTILNMQYAAVLDYDALMRCENSISHAQKKILTSSVFYALNRSDRLSKNDLERVSGAQSDIVKVDGGSWYPQDRLSELSRIARTNQIFILEKDIEGAIQTPKTVREKKPFRAMHRILERIEADKVPEEIRTVDSFLLTRIQESSTTS